MSGSVLIVDDDPDICETVQLVLERYGIQVDSASDGRAALALLHAGLRPRLILLDVMMPGMNGYEFRAAQLGDPALAGIPVVVLTGDGHAAEKGAALRSRAVRKPIDVATLLELVGGAS